MQKFACVIMASGLYLASMWPVHARNTKLLLPIVAAIQTKESQEKLGRSVKFFFGTQKHPKILRNLGTDVSNRKTNSFNKTDARACNWAFLSAMVSLKNRARQLGANAVVNIVSYYKKVPMSSTTEFECHAGGVIAGVALKGDFVTIADK